MSTLEIINKEIQKEIAKPEIVTQLLNTTFKGLTQTSMKQAITEGMMRGFTFKDFLEKNIYAIPFGQGYSLITSIDYARKIGMRNGIVGISEPIYTYSDPENKIILACKITVKRKMADGYVGEYTAAVDFKEFNTNKNQWLSKPKIMIAKVAEMHALRKACPEELSQAYVEEEKQTPVQTPSEEKYIKDLVAIKTTEELKTYYLANKGQGKEFDKAVTIKKKELKDANL